jgi:uncharacterized membrane protein YhaH (DUF805 family)
MASDKSPVAWTLLPVRRYFEFSGRSGRAEYWWFTLVYTAVGVLLDAVDQGLGFEYGLLGLMFTLGLFIPSVSVTVRRLHDIGVSGWWLLAVIAPAAFFGFESSFAALDSEFNEAAPGNSSMVSLWLFVVACFGLVLCMVLPGKKGSNRYGPDPYDHGDVGTLAGASN